jgi:hypothetical protein
VRHAAGWEGFEQYVNDELGLDSTVASGSQFYDKGDGKHRDNGDWAYQVDAKYTEKASWPPVAKKMAKWVTEAALSGKRFALPVRLWPRDQIQPQDYVILPFEDFVELVRIARAQ